MSVDTGPKRPQQNVHYLSNSFHLCADNKMLENISQMSRYFVCVCVLEGKFSPDTT